MGKADYKKRGKLNHCSNYLLYYDCVSLVTEVMCEIEQPDFVYGKSLSRSARKRDGRAGWSGYTATYRSTSKKWRKIGREKKQFETTKTGCRPYVSYQRIQR